MEEARFPVRLFGPVWLGIEKDPFGLRIGDGVLRALDFWR